MRRTHTYIFGQSQRCVDEPIHPCSRRTVVDVEFGGVLVVDRVRMCWRWCCGDVVFNSRRPDRRIHPNMLRHTFATLAAYFGKRVCVCVRVHTCMSVCACVLFDALLVHSVVGALEQLARTRPRARTQARADVVISSKVIIINITSMRDGTIFMCLKLGRRAAAHGPGDPSPLQRAHASARVRQSWPVALQRRSFKLPSVGLVRVG